MLGLEVYAEKFRGRKEEKVEERLNTISEVVLAKNHPEITKESTFILTQIIDLRTFSLQLHDAKQ